MTPTVDRVWLCAIDIDRWSDVTRLVPRGHHTSGRLGRAERIAAVTSNALVNVAVHELAAPEIDSDLAIGGGPVDASGGVALDQVHYSVSHSDQAIAVAASLDPIGVEIESTEEMGASTALGLARTRAVRKANGRAASGPRQPHNVVDIGCFDGDGHDLWVSEVEWHTDFAIAVAAAHDRAPQVISTTASLVLDRWRETVEGLAKPLDLHEHRVQRRELG